MENKDIEFNSSIGEGEKKKFPLIPVIVTIIIVIAIGAAVYYINKGGNNDDGVAPSGGPQEDMEVTIGASDIPLTEEAKAAMLMVNKAAEEYFTQNRKELRLVSEYGFLYSYKNKSDILAKDVLADKNTGLSDDEINETDILYVRPRDFGYVLGQEIKGGDLALFTVLNTKDGYYATSEYTEPTLLTGEQYRNLVMMYSFAHGDLRNPAREDSENKAILRACMMTDYDIKHIACDDKYAVVVGNLTDSPADIKQAALMKDEDGWKVINDGLAASGDAVMEINEKYPDMELGLMPVYNISDFGSIDTKDMPDIIASLESLGEISDKDGAEGFYACGCGRFAYVECLATDKKLLGFIGNDGKLEFNKVADLQSAIAYMLQCDENPPVFILKFE